MNYKRVIFLSMILSIFLISPQGYTSATSVPAAQPTSGASETPSTVAVNACSDKEKGDACEFTNDKGGDSVNGRCGYTDNDQSKLVCVAYQ
jgi:hypothetical protein